MKRAVIFDLDGTLINSLPDISAAMNKVLISCGLPYHDEEEYKLFTGDGAKNLTLRALGEYGDCFDAVYQMYVREYALNSRVNTVPYPAITQMLKALSDAGLKLCVLSNKGDDDVKNVLAYYFPDQQFAYTGGVREGGPVKPDPRTVLEVLGALQLPAEDFWYVGDTATDMRCAAGAGIESIAVLWGFQTRQMIEKENPGHFVQTVKELQDLILCRAAIL